MKHILFATSAILLTLMLSACNQKIETNMSAHVDDFQFTTQDNETFGFEQVDGDWWIAYFFYTNCKMVCPQTTANMVTVQEQLKDDAFTPPIVGFSVDPDFDTPDILQTYADEYEIDLNNFTLLTGYEFQDIRTLSNESFHTVLEGGGPDDHAYAHSTFFFLVNPEGEVIKRYDGVSMMEVNELIEDVKKVM